MLELLSLPFSGGGGFALQGGSAGPSRADSSADGNYISMNNPFSVAGQGGRADATASNQPSSSMSMVVLALIAGAVLLVVTK